MLRFCPQADPVSLSRVPRLRNTTPVFLPQRTKEKLFDRQACYSHNNDKSGNDNKYMSTAVQFDSTVTAPDPLQLMQSLQAAASLRSSSADNARPEGEEVVGTTVNSLHSNAAIIRNQPTTPLQTGHRHRPNRCLDARSVPNARGLYRQRLTARWAARHLDRDLSLKAVSGLGKGCPLHPVAIHANQTRRKMSQR